MAATDFTSAGRVVSLVAPDAVSGGASLTGIELDSKGWRWLHVTITIGTMATAGDGSVTVQEATTSGGAFADITGAAFTLTAGDDGAVLHGMIDLEQQSRYIKVAGTVGATGATDISVVGVLYGCANTAEYIDATAGGADELAFTVLT